MIILPASLYKFTLELQWNINKIYDEFIVFNDNIVIGILFTLVLSIGIIYSNLIHKQERRK